ncbi:MAG: hypothetical protein ABIV43_01560 [Candidatus Saccharimonadales bacterium]
MLHSISTRRLIAYQILTIGFYYFYWCSVSGREVNAAAGRKIIPSAWFLALPAGNYWWAWHYAEALDLVTKQRLKSNDTFLIFILSTSPSLLLGGGGLNYGSGSPGDNISQHTIVIIAAIVITFFVLLSIAGATFFICYMQRKIDAVRNPIASA